MKKEEIKNTQATTAEEIVTVTPEAVDVATQGEIEAAKAAKKTAAAEKKAQKEAEKKSKDTPKLNKAKLNSDGKFVIKTYVASDGMQVYYIVQEGLKNERLFDVTAKALIAEGKAVTISREEFDKMVADAKENKKTDDNKEDK